MINLLKDKPWWHYLESDLQELISESFLLLDLFNTRKNNEFHDYAFIVFPAAKAYEGFLKKLFLDRGFISKEDYFGKRFRVGRALNPELEKRLRQESVYDKIVNYCGGRSLADDLWNTWKVSRNLIFHWFPDEKKAISLVEAKEKITIIVKSIDAASKECNIN